MTARTTDITKKRASAKTAKNKATALHSLIVRSRGHCENCGESGYSKLQCAHIISRRYAATRTNLSNAFCLCAKCHMRFTEWPLEFHGFVTSKIGQAQYLRLSHMATEGVPPDWHEEVSRLSTIWADIEASF